MKIYNHPDFGSDFFVLTSDNCPNTLSAFYGYYYNNEAISIRVNPCEILDKYTAGAYVNIQMCEKQIIIQQDYFCSFGIYVFKFEDYWAISNSFYLLVCYLSDKYLLHENDEYLALCNYDMIAFSITETAIKEIFELPQGKYITINPSTKELNFEWFNYRKGAINPYTKEGLAILDNWHQKYSNIVSSLMGNKYVVSVDLSGGFDSRMAFSSLCKPDLWANAFIFSANDEIYTHKEDYEIASEIGKIYGFKLREPDADSEVLDCYHAIINTLKTKWLFHSQFYFKRHYCTKPLFNINGFGGEALRIFYTHEDSDDFINAIMSRYKFYGRAHSDKAKACMKRTINYMQEKYRENIHAPQKLFTYCYNKNHFGRTSAESLLCNMISITPLMDPILYNYDLSIDPPKNRTALPALIISRYMPEIINLKFQGGRIIAPEIWNFVNQVNAAYPYTIQDQGTSISVLIDNDRFDMDYNLPLSISTVRQFTDLYKTDVVKEFVIKKYGEKHYQNQINSTKSKTYAGFQSVTRLLSEYFLDNILRKRMGYDFPFSQLYRPANLINNLSEIGEFIAIPGLSLQLGVHQSCFIQKKDCKNDVCGPEYHQLKLIVDDFKFTSYFQFVNNGQCNLILKPIKKKNGWNVNDFMVDIMKLSIYSVTFKEEKALVKDIFCLRHNAIKINFNFLNKEVIMVELDWLPNELWVYNIIKKYGKLLDRNFKSCDSGELLGGDSVSNQLNL